MRMGYGRRTRLIVLGFLALAAAATGASVGARIPDGDLTSLTRRLDELAREKARVRQRLLGVKRRERQVTRQLARIDARLGEAEARLDRVSADVDSTRVELRHASRECERAEARLTEQKVFVAERLVAVYQSGEAHPLEVVLGSSSFSDFANRLYLLDQIVGRDVEIIEEFDAAQQEARDRREELQARHEELRALQSEVAEEKQRTSDERRSTEQRKLDLLRTRAGWERALAELEQDSREIEQMLLRLQRTEAGQERLARPWHGNLITPVRGKLTSGFGYRNHPIYRVRKMHTGVDLSAPTGTPIRAAGDGTVVFAGRWGGYGNCIIVDHGGSMATLYAHCSRLAVTSGQPVTQAQVIGYVGSTGLSTGPHLHFEVRREGRPVNPMPYL